MAEVKKWAIGDFLIGRKIGTGLSGNVYVVKEKTSEFVLAIKMIKKDFIQDNGLHNQLKREIEIHSHLINPNILRLYGYFHDESRVYLMVEIAPYGALFGDLRRYGCYTEERAATYMHQLILALQYCHARNVLHRDIKPENILIANKGQIKLADFGWSVHNKTGQRNTLCGTLDYLCPEMIENGTYTKEIDIWCSGVLMYEMLTVTVPFSNKSEEITMELIKRAEFTFPDFARVELEAKDMISKILVLNPKDRLTLEQMAEHPYIRKYSENTTNECKAAFEMWENAVDDESSKSFEAESESDDSMRNVESGKLSTFF